MIIRVNTTVHHCLHKKRKKEKNSFIQHAKKEVVQYFSNILSVCFSYEVLTTSRYLFPQAREKRFFVRMSRIYC